MEVSIMRESKNRAKERVFIPLLDVFLKWFPSMWIIPAFRDVMFSKSKKPFIAAFPDSEIF
jgi:hypothetical protein